MPKPTKDLIISYQMKEPANTPAEETHETFKYPGGELQVRLSQDNLNYLKSKENDDFSLVIDTRIKNSDDIMELLLFRDALSEKIDEDIFERASIFLAYLPYARADRRFVEGDCHGKNTFLRMIARQFPFQTIYTLDIHSLTNLEDEWFTQDLDIRNVSAAPILEDVLETTRYIYRDVGLINILFPDEGAATRYTSDDYEFLNDKTKYVISYCTKDRDQVTGKLNGFNVPEIDKSLPTLVVDDLCDGGGTFLGIASKLQMDRNLLSLYVTHGLFSKGLGQLGEAFSKIYTTNSFFNIEDRMNFVSEDCKLIGNSYMYGEPTDLEFRLKNDVVLNLIVFDAHKIMYNALEKDLDDCY